jgi:hypothetical protein
MAYLTAARCGPVFEFAAVQETSSLALLVVGHMIPHSAIISGDPSLTRPSTAARRTAIHLGGWHVKD